MEGKSRWLLILGILALVAVGEYWLTAENKSQSTPVSAATEGATPTVQSAAQSAESNSKIVRPARPEPDAVAATLDRKTTPQTPSVVELFPDAEELRQAVAQNPHQTPEGILHFSVAVAQRLENLKTASEANQFMSELEDCVARSQAAPANTPGSIESLCLRNAHRARDKFPTLSGRYFALRAKAGDQARLFDDN